MNVHYIGVMVKGKYGRLPHRYTEKEFEALVACIGGTLPPGWVAWHFEEHENVANSNRVKRFAEVQRFSEVPQLAKELELGPEPTCRTIQLLMIDAVCKWRALAPANE